jgi:methylated-DNA-[protein]-cysteine S-methyltransferase
LIERDAKRTKVPQVNENFFAYYKSPIGLIEISGTEKGIWSVTFLKKKLASATMIHPCLRDCCQQLDEYFKGKRKIFSLKLILRGTDFQKRVWRHLMKIPHGKTASYGDVARAIRNAKAVRAVGNANGKNPISIIIPCHRVIGSNGDMVGFGGGIWRKKWLLRHEMGPVTAHLRPGRSVSLLRGNRSEGAKGV